MIRMLRPLSSRVFTKVSSSPNCLISQTQAQSSSKLCSLCQLRTHQSYSSSLFLISNHSNTRISSKQYERPPKSIRLNKTQISRFTTASNLSVYRKSQATISNSESSLLDSKKIFNSGYESESQALQSSFEALSSGQLSVDGFGDFDADSDEEAEPIRDLTNAQPMRSEKGKSKFARYHEFIDYRKVRVRGGKGGDGMICFMSLYMNPLAGPSGGDGGNGGHVILEASKSVRSLNKIRGSYVGNPGEGGQHKDMTGASADHSRILVPVGTLVKDAYTGQLLADISEHGMLFLAAKGGAGGKGNHYFLSDKNRHPKVAEVGADGVERNLILEMKILAQAGLVGLPNAGKSTLLAAVSRAKPKVAAYPFTTLKPNIGIVHYDDNEQLAIADLPGIIEGASENKGLGLAFLKHVERCVCLLYVVDIADQIPAFRQLEILMSELDKYKDGLSTRPKAIIVNKMDTEYADVKLEEFRESLKAHEGQFGRQDTWRVIPISAKYGHNIAQLLVQFRQLYDWHRYETFSKL